MNKLALVSLVALGTLVLGCAPDGGSDPEDEDPGEAQQAVGNNPPTGNNHNRTKPHWAVDTHTAYRYIGAHALDAGHGRLPVLKIDSDYRDDVLSNAIECGLSQSQFITDPVTGVTFQGHWGLAPGWMNAPLGTLERRWVTGCMAQRLNATGKTVPILLEGYASAIQRNTTYDPLYPWDESTVWGDLFSSDLPLVEDGPPYNLYVCHDSDLAGSCTHPDTPSSWLQYRICDSSPSCGLVLMGSCSDPAVCQTGTAGYPICTTPGGLFFETVHLQLTGGTCHPQ